MNKRWTHISDGEIFMPIITNLFNTFLTYPIFNALMELYHLLGDLGLAIVALTTLVFLLTFPFTWKGLKVTRATQALQPQLAEIKRRYPNDLAAQSQAQSALYKEHGISLSSSFGPLLIQSGVLSGLFFALNSVLRTSTLSSINRIMYPFLIHFRTLPDLSLTWFTIFNALWHISLGYPDPTHILPILTGLMTLVQMRMAQPITQTGQSIMQVTQSMQFLLLLLSVGLTVFFAWQFAAGVALYRLVWLLLSAVQRYFVTGWGSLWVMPRFATAGSSRVSDNQSAMNVRQRSSSGRRAKGHRGGGASARRRGKRPGRNR
jgi:YidC/Oxa1 family membrane protein insertase